jgi:hypothetical protein
MTFLLTGDSIHKPARLTTSTPGRKAVFNAETQRRGELLFRECGKEDKPRRLGASAVDPAFQRR